MRIPIAADLESRDGSLRKDAFVKNALIEVAGQDQNGQTTLKLRKRPGVVLVGTIKVGTAQLLYSWNGLQAIIGDYLNSGTVSSIVSAPVQVNLSSTNPNLPFTAQETSNEAATPRLMFKNRTQAWTLKRDGSVTAVTYGGTMGSETFNVTGITRSGTTATVTMAVDPGFHVDDSVTIAGAGQAAYNGTISVTAATPASFTPERDITISSLTRVSTTATAVATAHGLTNGSSYAISGANQSAYNGTFAVTVVDANTFTYTVAVANGVSITTSMAGGLTSGSGITGTMAGGVTGVAAADPTPLTFAIDSGVTSGSGQVSAYAPGVQPSGTFQGNFTYSSNTQAVVAAGIAASINAQHPTPDLTATSSGPNVTISAPAGSRDTWNGLTVSFLNPPPTNTTSQTFSGGVSATAEVLATCSVDLSSTLFTTISSVTVHGVSIANAAVPFNGSNAQTAADLAASINTKISIPDYTATASGSVVTIKAKAGSGATPNGFAVVVNITRAATCTVNLAAITFTSISDLTVNGVTVINAAVPFNSTNTQTAADLAASINAKASSPDYTATSSGAVVTIAAVTTGTGPNGFVVNLSSDLPGLVATGAIRVVDPAVTVVASFTYTVAGSPATPATGTITAQGSGGTVPGIPYINGYFFVMDSNGVVWNSALDDPTSWDSLAFIIAQSVNGAGRALTQSGNYLVALKEWSAEYFYDAKKSPGSPLDLVSPAFADIGCASGDSAIRVNGVPIWISQTKEQPGRAVHILQGLTPVKVSTLSVERILDADDLVGIEAMPSNFDGHPVYIVTLPTSNVTLMYDFNSKMWGTLTALNAGSPVSVSSITFDNSNDIATATVAAPGHGLSDGDPVTIAGADQPEYNGTFPALVVDADTFTTLIPGNPGSSATGTITATGYTESTLPASKIASHLGAQFALHDTAGLLLQLSTTVYQDAAAPIDTFARSQRLDGGTLKRKKMSRLRVVGDAQNDIVLVRWSDDDCATFSSYQRVDLSEDQPELRKGGSFRRRTLEMRHTGNNQINLLAYEPDIG